jgi:hypothetical protein
VLIYSVVIKLQPHFPLSGSFFGETVARWKRYQAGHQRVTRMKDQLVVLLEALRLARLELECYRDPQCRASADWTVQRLDELLNDRAVTAAMSTLSPETESPPLAPAHQPSEAPSSLTQGGK